MDNNEPKKAEVKEPSRKVLTEWLVSFIRDRKPEPKTYITPQEVEGETGVSYEDEELHFALIDAKKQLYRGTPAYEFRVTKEGLLFLDDEGRVGELGRRIRSSRNLLAEAHESQKTINEAALDENGKRRLERTRAVTLHLLNEAHRASRRQFKTDTPPKALPG